MSLTVAQDGVYTVDIVMIFMDVGQIEASVAVTRVG